ncbi:hypothetical protein ACFC08_01090 [Streptomyces sp. NPDC056112]|uniref:hypothetical protein n=1 Tax=Streptomyces sp. NPDC056112 TaxID=3345715 RepID=UPI0035D7A9C4
MDGSPLSAGPAGSAASLGDGPREPEAVPPDWVGSVEPDDQPSTVPSEVTGG